MGFLSWWKGERRRIAGTDEKRYQENQLRDRRLRFLLLHQIRLLHRRVATAVFAERTGTRSRSARRGSRDRSAEEGIATASTPLLPLRPITGPEKRYQENQLREFFNGDCIVFDFFFFIFFIRFVFFIVASRPPSSPKEQGLDQDSQEEGVAIEAQKKASQRRPHLFFLFVRLQVHSWFFFLFSNADLGV
ncbi:hypothetical protein Syun_003672 [Stephania yunnanensis]|uniref:Uncharacterized protein n=1 Tax=Stephania yunnanensis TaxID=152371 RepID=A0AAP0L2K6_9MAGN